MARPLEVTAVEVGPPRRVATHLPAAFDRRTLEGVPGHSIEVSPLCIGAVTEPRVVEAAFDRGVNFFFISADFHFRLYDATREGLENLIRRLGPGGRERLVVAAATYTANPLFFPGAFYDAASSVQGLGRLGLLVAGGCYKTDATRIGAARDLRNLRRFGAACNGATFHDRSACAESVEEKAVDLAFVRYNPGHGKLRPFAVEELPRNGTLVYTFKSMFGWVRKDWPKLGLPQGAFQPRPTDYYRYAFTNSRVEGILCSPQTVSQLKELISVMGGPILTPDEESHMEGLFYRALRVGALIDQPDAQ